MTDSLVVHLEDPAGGNGELLLFVRAAPGRPRRRAAPADRAARCAPRCRRATCPTGSSRVPAVPRNRTGKKLEVPVKKILRGAAPDDGGQPATSLADPARWTPFVGRSRRQR